MNNTPEIINLGSTSPKLSVSSPNESGTIKLNNLPSLDTSTGLQKKSVNFGPGAEMLMNNKTPRSSSPKSDIKLDELKSLEVNENSMSRKSAENLMNTSAFSRPSIIKPLSGDGIKLNVTELDSSKSNLGSATAPKDKASTWDGFTKFNEIPVNPDINVPEKPKLSTDETLKQKLIFLRKLEALEKKGIKLTKKYTMEDPLAEMQGEYEMIKSEKEKSNSVKFQGKMLMAAVSAIEFLNGKFDPFDIKLDGWGESVSENMDDYDEVFGELHEKYGGKTKMAPEIKLLFMLGGSAAMLHMTNTMFKSSMPGMDDIMRQNPEMMQQFTSAAVNSMQNTNPGFSGFMGNFMPGASNDRPPPPPAQTQTNRSQSERTAPPANRPDIMRARNDDGINIQEQFAAYGEKESAEKSMRPEMKGPSDISDILSGLKTMSNNNGLPTNNANASTNNASTNNESTNKVITPTPPTITKSQMPSKKASSGKTPRKQKSDKNTVSLDM